MEQKDKMFAVVGPTATGKTSLSIELAKLYNAEILSCDSMQIYKGLEIGTAKPSKQELSEVPHHMISVIDAFDAFSVADYVSLADKEIADIKNRGKNVIVVGGTGLYVRSLLKGISFSDDEKDIAVRENLQKELEEKGIESLYQRLKEVDEKSAEQIHMNNHKRVIRALEYYEINKEPISKRVTKTKQSKNKYDYTMICLAYKDREKLYERINLRVDLMLQNGLVEEAKSFYDEIQVSDTIPTAAQAIGYKELFAYFKGEKSLDEAVEDLKQSTRRYAKRQMTWFRKEENIDFIYIDDYKTHEEMLVECKKIIEA